MPDSPSADRDKFRLPLRSNKIFQDVVMKLYLRSLMPGLVVLTLASSIAAREAGSPKLRRAPDFALPDYQGKQASLADFRGRVVLLQFFQTGCPVCQRQAPILEELYRKYKDRGLVVIGVSHDTGGAEAVKQFAQRFDLTYFLLLGDLEIAVRYIGITPQVSRFDVPRYFLINRDGYIVRDIDATVDKELSRDEKGELEKAVLEALH
jgi:peroxiredoxin